MSCVKIKLNLKRLAKYHEKPTSMTSIINIKIKFLYRNLGIDLKTIIHFILRGDDQGSILIL